MDKVVKKSSVIYKYNDREKDWSVFSSDKNIKVANILSEIDGQPVTSIDKYAVTCCKSLKTITIPSTITNIGSFAFCECVSLTDVVTLSTSKEGSF